MNRQQLLAWQLAAVQALGHVGIWEFHPSSEKLVWSAETCRIMGIDNSGFDGRVETFLSLVHPDDRAMVTAALRENRRQPRRTRLEHRIVRPDGTVRHVREHGVPYRAESGALMFMTSRRCVNRLKALRALSRKLLETLEAMGVETAGQRNFLAMHGCRAFQGYLFGRPVAAEQF